MRLLQPELFGDLVEVEVDLALLLADPVKTCVKVQPLTLTNLEQKLDGPAVLGPQRWFLLLLEPLSQLEQLVVPYQHVDA